MSGDSAGATLILSMLLVIGALPKHKKQPGFASLISPWPTLFSTQNRDTRSDFLNADTLHLYGRQYAGSEENLNNATVSPGLCKNVNRWLNGSPSGGFSIMFGSEEVLGPEIRDLVQLLRKSGCDVSVREEYGSIHAWPVAALFLADSKFQRLKGLKDLTKMVRRAIEV